jgi:hypothetical protein
MPHLGSFFNDMEDWGDIQFDYSKTKEGEEIIVFEQGGNPIIVPKSNLEPFINWLTAMKERLHEVQSSNQRQV